MKKLECLMIFSTLLLKCAFADVYLHNLRGSNNRWNENGRNRNNANRMFDSQNNARGGYNVGSLYYYVGSKLQLEWTNQHSCYNENNHCDIVLQYMCGPQVRDGTSTSTIPSNPAQCENLDCNEDRRYGMHEDFYHYQNCRLRKRNGGLYTASENVREYASSTRQNQKANRYGYECAEERDYYPNWHPSPWKDIAILTNDVSRCAMYQNESQNVKERYACKVDPAFLYQYSNKNPPDNKYIPITEAECNTFVYEVNGESKLGEWTRYPAHGIAAPNCVESQYSRDNHLGNTVGGQTINYNWTIPDSVNEHCTLRIRYNITTGDYDRDNTTSIHNNRRARDGPGPDLWTQFGLTSDVGLNRGYKLKDNPQVDIFNNEKFKLQLAITTEQYGRTFQDRSHTFAIRPRPPSISSDAQIVNVNVRGKRGNIVQVYPAVEYDFVPNTAVVQKDGYVHYQWTGSDNNPGNNDGQGRASTDRSNVVMIKSAVYTEGSPSTYKTGTYGQLGSSYPSHLTNASLGGLIAEDMKALSILRDHLGGDMDELNDAGTYFDLGPRKVTQSGNYNYMCTRNNNFSNRSQKGKLVVTDAAFANEYIGALGGSVSVPNTGGGTSTEVVAPPGALTQGQLIGLSETTQSDITVVVHAPNSDYVSDFVKLEPEGKISSDSAMLTLKIKLNGDLPSLYVPEVYMSADGTNTWNKLALDEHQSGYVSFRTDSGGHYVVSKSVDAGPMAGLILGVIVGVLLLVGIIVLLKKNRNILASYKNKV
uniref:Protein DD3-3 n=1 Tax=Phallusia mammillata TaxID=59560 RepID=A0A6F9D8C0_9ASCI|nr:protein DD3-3 [Phallusia mammillata]